MTGHHRFRADLLDAMDGAEGLSSADRLCVACVDLLDIDGASISLVQDGTMSGTFGSSGALSRQLDELQFTFGEGPCMDAVSNGRPVLTPDIVKASQGRWPAFAPAVLDAGVRAVFALPISVARMPVAALDLFRLSAGPLSPDDMSGGLLAAELARLPILDLISGATDWMTDGTSHGAWAQLKSLERVEVYQATGMIMAQLDIRPADALARLRAHAFSSGQTASDVAWAIVERRLQLETHAGDTGTAGTG